MHLTIDICGKIKRAAWDELFAFLKIDSFLGCSEQYAISEKSRRVPDVFHLRHWCNLEVISMMKMSD